MPPGAPAVLYLSRAHRRTAGGMERLSFELIEALQQRGSRVRVLAHRGGRAGLPWFFLRCLLLAPLAARQVNVVHIGDPFLAPIGWLCRFLWRMPVIVTVHGLDITYPALWYQWYLRRWFDHLNHYVAISDHVKSLLQQRKVRGEITVIHPGFYDRWYDPAISRADLDRLLARATIDQVVLATVGRLVPRKGHAWFIENVLPQLPTKFMYVIAGEGPADSSIRQAAVRAGVEHRVLLLGRISVDDQRVLYNTVDVFVQPNIEVPHDVEGFGIVLLEASSSGRLVLAARSGGITDAIIDQRNGVLLPAGHADEWIKALQAVATTGAPEALSPTSVRSVTLAHYEWQTIISEYLALYQLVARR